jgi:hypothetical protein
VEGNENGDGYVTGLNVAEEVAFLKGLERDSELTSIQIGNEYFEGYIENSEFVGEYWLDEQQTGQTGTRRTVSGVMTVVFATVNG